MIPMALYQQMREDESLDSNGLAKYRWKITKVHLDCLKDEKGTEGPRLHNPEIKDNRQHFVMKDDDGIAYYEGDIYGEYDGFEPLDDFGEPNAGCTSIFYGGKIL
jgi:hypothetical protein